MKTQKRLTCPLNASFASVVTVFRNLVNDLEIELADEEKLDDAKAVRRVFDVLRARGPALFLLDNVDHPALLAQQQMKLLADQPWARVLYTTRLAPDEFTRADAMIRPLDLDRLPENQAVDFIRRYQPGQAFASSEHEAAAREIVRELSGLTLAVETAAVYLGQCDPRVAEPQYAVDVRNYLTKLREDLKTGGSEGVMSQLREVTATLRPTLARLDAPARTVLQIASLLAPDGVALPWVRAIAGQSHPELATDAATGESDPWTQLIRGLIGMRLFQPTPEPRVVTIHRILQRVLETELPERREQLQTELEEYMSKRAEFIFISPIPPNNWEVKALADSLLFILAGNPIHPKLAACAGAFSEKVKIYCGLEAARRLLAAGIAIIEPMSKADPENATWLLCSYQSLGDIELATGNLTEAQENFLASLGVTERLAANDSGNTMWQVMLAKCMTKLGQVAIARGQVGEANRSFMDALKMQEGHLVDQCNDMQGQWDIEQSIEKLGEIALMKGDADEARQRFEQSLAMRKRLTAKDPSNVIWQSNLAAASQRLGDLEMTRGAFNEARRFYIDSLNIAERLTTKEPANTHWKEGLSAVFEKLGDLALAQGNVRDAKSWVEKSLGTWEDLSKKDQTNTGWLHGLGVSLDRLGDNRHAVLVIDDAGLGFRTMPAKGSWPTGVSVTEQQPNWIILKMADPIAMGDLWREIIGGDRPARRKNLIVVVAADELRRAGAAVSRGFSWESTLTELCAELNDNPVFKPLLQFPGHLIVNFGCEGAVWFGEPDAGQAAILAQNLATLVYDPTLPEDGWKTRLPDEDQVYGHMNTFTAAIALAAADASLTDPKVLNAALSQGLGACRLLRLKGHGDVSIPKPGPPLTELAKLLTPKRTIPDVENPILKNLIPQGFQTIHGPVFRTKPGDAALWTLAALAENPPDQPQLPLFGLAHRVALYGLPELRRIPHAHFGGMVSVDRIEIETLRSLTQLIRRYLDEKLPKQPLSIAAFGPPGAGKSFGIKEIARQVLGPDVPILEFNLSQFDSASDLFGAFHQVRDNALKNLVPVVFWDEFDSRDYKWLQYLLAPMQDGAFEENGHTHAIGKCLFVFAGGTSWDFENFGPAPMPEGWSSGCLKPKQQDGPEPAEPSRIVAQMAEFYVDNPQRVNADATANEEFRRKKGPDFLSRLDGHINVLGPNQRTLYNWGTRAWDQADPHDITFPVRRALLLRQFLGAKKPGEILNIDRDLLRAFLHVPRYRHGARSLEKIARHLGLARPPFRRAELPPPQVLSQHLDTFAEFDRIYHQTHHLLTPPAIEAMASAINEGYNSDNPSSWNKSFDKLDAFLQQSNRAAALRIPYILALAGLRLTLRPGGHSKTNLGDPNAIGITLKRDSTPEESAVSNHIEKHVEVLAEEEHRLWVQFHEENGWRYGSKELAQPDPNDPARTITTLEKDKTKLLHPCIASFHEMPDNYGQREKWQDFDRNAVRRYPRLLRLTEFEITFARSETPFAGAKIPPTLAPPHPPPP